ncbi:MAG: regulator of protease activity HflC (stomatin/prohibitin superfamily) [Myxococcota bacterium]
MGARYGEQAMTTPDLPEATLRDHLRVTGGWLPAALLVLAGLTVMAGSSSGSTALLASAGLLLAAAIAAAQVRSQLQATLAGTTPSRARLWPLAWGSAAAIGAALVASDLPAAGSDAPFAALAALAGAAVCAGIARYWEGVPWPLAPWARAGAWSLAAAGLGIASRGTWPVDAAILPVLQWGLAALAIEGLSRGLWAVFRRTSPPGPGSWLLAVPFSAADPVSSVFRGLDRGLGIDLRHTWALTWARQAVFPMSVALAAVAWLVTALTVIEVHEEGVLERLGRPVADLAPGLHVHLPWPVDVVRRVDVHRVRERTIGYAGAAEGASLLWTKTHAAEEYALLLGDGRDLVAVNARLQYRPASARAWLYSVRNPEAGVEALAYRALTDHTRGASLEGVLSENLSALAHDVEARLRDEATPLGIEVVAFTLDGLHPPVAVADRYQAVVAAQIDQQTSITEAQGYRAARLPEAEAEAARAIGQAEAAAHSLRGQAAGEAAGFTAVAAAHALAPALFETRRRLEAMEAALSDRPFTVVDSRFERDGGVLWVTE